MRDICRWHVEEFAYLLERMKSIPEGDGNLLDHTCAVFVHEHAEANPHKCNGLAILLAGGAGKMKTGMHTKSHNSHRRRLPDDRRRKCCKTTWNFPTGRREDERDRLGSTASSRSCARSDPRR